jgi:hypothetical protein
VLGNRKPISRNNPGTISDSMVVFKAFEGDEGLSESMS